MSLRGFGIGVAAWLAALLGAVALLLWAITRPGYHALAIVAAVAVAGAVAGLWRHVRAGHLETARFIEALTHGDFTASFGHRGEGAGLDVLGEAMNGAMVRLRSERASAQEEQRTLGALVEEVPIPLLSIADDGRLSLLNKAARRLFATPVPTRIADLAPYGPALAVDLANARPGERKVTRLTMDGSEVAATLSLAEVREPGAPPLRLVTVQPIQSELDRVEMTAWRDLVRVLTHEIMNSVTPITSLARSAAELMAEVEGNDPRLTDARDCVETVARRAEGVTRFVQSYRQVSRTPSVRLADVPVAPLIDEVARLFRADWPADRVALDVSVDPPSMAAELDPDLIAQLLLNLLKNGAEAAIEHAAAPALRLTARRNRSGRLLLDVEDNGPGIPPERAHEVFLPFFTTKKQGTGVGLSLARQIVHAHGGSIGVGAGTLGGARFRITL